LGVDSKGFGIEKQLKDTQDFYIKEVVKQDIDRTPSIGVKAIRNYFKVELNNGEATFLVVNYNGHLLPIEIKKRETREEFRMFITKFIKVIKFEPGDLLVFGKTEETVHLFLVKSGSLIISKLRGLLKNRKHYIGPINIELSQIV